MPRYITLTDHEDHGQGASPVIFDADRVVMLSEFQRSTRYSGSGGAASGVGTKVELLVGETIRTVYVRETIYTVASRVEGDSTEEAR